MENSKKKTEQETERRQHHVLVCISASPTSRTVIRTASASVSAYGCRFSALYVKTELDEKNREQLQENLDFAKSCGAKIFVLERNSVQEINAFASNSGITDIYIGKSGSRRSIMRKGTMMERLVHALPGARLHVVPDEDVVLQPSRIMRQNTPRFNIRDVMITIGVMTIATIISLLVFESDINNANIVTIYILAVLVRDPGIDSFGFIVQAYDPEGIRQSVRDGDASLPLAHMALGGSEPLGQGEAVPEENRGYHSDCFDYSLGIGLFPGGA